LRPGFGQEGRGGKGEGDAEALGHIATLPFSC
jgi:hypothetical protein